MVSDPNPSPPQFTVQCWRDVRQAGGVFRSRKSPLRSNRKCSSSQRAQTGRVLQLLEKNEPARRRREVCSQNGCLNGLPASNTSDSWVDRFALVFIWFQTAFEAKPFARFHRHKPIFCSTFFSMPLCLLQTISHTENAITLAEYLAPLNRLHATMMARSK